MDAVLAAAPLPEKDVYKGQKKRRGRRRTGVAVAGVSVDESANVCKGNNTR